MKLFEADTATAGGGTATAEPPASIPDSGSLVTGVQPDTASTPPPASGQPPAAPSPVTGGWINQDGTFTPDWTGRLPEDMRGESESLKKYGNVTDLARGMINAQRLIGKKGVILPTEKSTPEEIAEYRKAVGVPDTADGYGVKPETLPDGVEWSDDLAKPFLAIAHKHNVSKAALKELVTAHAQMEGMRTQTAVQMAQAEAQQKFETGIKELQQSWGREFDTNRQKVAQLAAYAGIPVDSPGFSDPNMAKLIYRLSKDFSEDRLVAIGKQTTTGSAAQAAKDIMTNPDNPDYKKYHGGDKDTQARVRAYLEQAERDRSARV